MFGLHECIHFIYITICGDVVSVYNRGRDMVLRSAGYRSHRCTYRAEICASYRTRMDNVPLSGLGSIGSIASAWRVPKKCKFAS